MNICSSWYFHDCVLYVVVLIGWDDTLGPEQDNSCVGKLHEFLCVLCATISYGSFISFCVLCVLLFQSRISKKFRLSYLSISFLFLYGPNLWRMTLIWVGCSRNIAHQVLGDFEITTLQESTLKGLRGFHQLAWTISYQVLRLSPSQYHDRVKKVLFA